LLRLLKKLGKHAAETPKQNANGQKT